MYLGLWVGKDEEFGEVVVLEFGRFEVFGRIELFSFMIFF